MSTTTIPQTASVQVRRRRARLQNHVRSGGSLTILLREGRPELESVELLSLMLWLPYVGPRKAHRMLRSLPERFRLSMLDAEQRAALITRVAHHERCQLARSIIASNITDRN